MNDPFLFNPIDPAVRRDPYALYERGRREHPAFLHTGLPVSLVSIFRYADVQAVLRDTALFSNDFGRGRALAPEIQQLAEQAPPSMLGMDPPDHTRLRSLVNKAFTPRIVRQLEPRLRAVAHELLDEALERRDVDLVQALTYPLPVTAIAEIIGVPPADREQFKVWSDQAVATLGTAFFAPPTVEQFQRQLAVRDEMSRYFVPLAEQRKREPKDDLLTGLVQAEHEGSKLDHAEMLAMLVLLLVAGNETTTTLIGNAVLSLLEHPGELKRLRDDPALMQLAVDEVLRFESPVQFDPRRANHDTQIAGTPIAENTLVLSWIGSANRDERVFGRPEVFDITRQKNPHLAFGYGTHHCLGHNLARLEASVALEVLLARTSSFERTDNGPLPLHPSPVFKAVTKLPVRLIPA
ncbi:MAG TPA: cytochrome P450 [Myxococcota bacterium]|jgi:cytochrome P450|nr:cytochrome P450 [Myxococcota bacterium]